MRRCAEHLFPLPFLPGMAATFADYLGMAMLTPALPYWCADEAGMTPAQVATWTGAITTALWSAALFLPLYLLWLPGNLAAASVGDIALQVVYQGLIATVLAMLLYLRAVSSIGPAAMGALMALVPVVSGLLAVPVLGEALSVTEAVALAVASVGAVLASGLLRRRQPEAR